ncbi:hypothetical protein M8J76_009610 [Diaphorina citri]|nr:hypothetical protein M8J75_013091 [Diaphorina citri]KAI5745267.1 hypothetical protein M8J76_009610 [Diaphorina citri]
MTLIRKVLGLVPCQNANRFDLLEAQAGNVVIIAISVRRTEARSLQFSQVCSSSRRLTKVCYLKTNY